MGSNFSNKPRSKSLSVSQISQKHKSCDIIMEDEKNTDLGRGKIISNSSSLSNFYRGYHRKCYSISSHSSSGSSSLYEVSGKDFVQKIQGYLQSIEHMGEISNLKFFFGNLMLTTEEGSFSVEVKDNGEPIVTLESEPNHSGTFMVYQYSAKGLSSSYTYFTMLYITDVDRSDSRYYVLQAGGNTPNMMPTCIPRRIKTTDNPKLISPFSRFVGTFGKEGTKRTNIGFITKDLQPFYLAQSDLSLDFTTDEFRAGSFSFNNQSSY